jgi:hypothetical protein
MGAGRGEEGFVVGEAAEYLACCPRETTEVLAGHDVEEQPDRLVVEQVEVVLAEAAVVDECPGGEDVDLPAAGRCVPGLAGLRQRGQVADSSNVRRALRSGRHRDQRPGETNR